MKPGVDFLQWSSPTAPDRCPKCKADDAQAIMGFFERIALYICRECGESFHPPPLVTRRFTIKRPVPVEMQAPPNDTDAAIAFSWALRHMERRFLLGVDPADVEGDHPAFVMISSKGNAMMQPPPWVAELPAEGRAAYIAIMEQFAEELDETRLRYAKDLQKVYETRATALDELYAEHHPGETDGRPNETE